MKPTIIKTSFNGLAFKQSSQEKIAEEIKNLAIHSKLIISKERLMKAI